MEEKIMDIFSFFMKANSSMRNEWFDFLSSSARPGGVVFAGDSLFQEFCVHEILCLPKDIQIHNRGIGGDTTSGLLKRVQNSILALKPSIVFILIGTNDLNSPDYDEKTSIGNIRKILNISKRELPNTKLVLIGILPVNPNIDAMTVGSRSIKIIRHFNTLLKNLAHECDCTFIDLYPVLSDKEGLLCKDFTRDGLHLKPSGYKALLEGLMPFLQF